MKLHETLFTFPPYCSSESVGFVCSFKEAIQATKCDHYGDGGVSVYFVVLELNQGKTILCCYNRECVQRWVKRLNNLLPLLLQTLQNKLFLTFEVKPVPAGRRVSDATGG